MILRIGVGLACLMAAGAASARCYFPESVTSDYRKLAAYVAENADVVIEGKVAVALSNEHAEVIEAERVLKGPQQRRFVMRFPYLEGGIHIVSSARAPSLGRAEGERVVAALNATPEGYVLHECIGQAMSLHPAVPGEVLRYLQAIRERGTAESNGS